MQFRIFFYLLPLLLWGCYSSDSISPSEANDTGIAGSYARFLVVGDYMYVVDDTQIKTFSLADPTTPELLIEQLVGERIETIFRLDNRLFIGSGTGLYLYTLSTDGIPEFSGQYLYSEFGLGFEPCDPVVANDTIAFVTLNSTNRVSRCRVNTVQLINQLNIFDITDFTNPQLIGVYEMIEPKGVGLDGSTLFVCDDGLKVFDVTDPYNLQLVHHFTDFETYDVIPLGGLLLVIGPDNVYQYDYSDLPNMQRISQIPIGS